MNSKKVLKDYNELKIRQLMRWELDKLLADKKEEYEELQYIIKPTQLKAEIRKIIQNEIRETLEDEINKSVKWQMQSFFRDIEPVIKHNIIEKTNEINFKDVFKKHISDLFKSGFKKVIQSAIIESDKHFNEKVSKRISQLTSLKTSTIQEIRYSSDDIVRQDKKYLEELDNFQGDEKYIQYFKEAEVRPR